MREIIDLKNKFCKAYATKCDKTVADDVFTCDLKDQCICKLAAEVQAYLYTILPPDFQHLTIFDFDGYKDSVQLIDEKKVLDIKEKIGKYCWGMSWKKLRDIGAKNKLDADKLSIMDRRYERGDSVVIHGDADKKAGRTLAASIILREAIRRRFSSNVNALQTYEWIEFSDLKALARDKRLADYQYADWLVVDNCDKSIETAPLNIQNYIVSLLDPFFLARLSSHLPTIMVFRFNLKDVPIQQIFGVGVDRIVSSTRTVKISLS